MRPHLENLKWCVGKLIAIGEKGFDATIGNDGESEFPPVRYLGLNEIEDLHHTVLREKTFTTTASGDQSGGSSIASNLHGLCSYKSAYNGL